MADRNETGYDRIYLGRANEQELIDNKDKIRSNELVIAKDSHRAFHKGEDGTLNKIVSNYIFDTIIDLQNADYLVEGDIVEVLGYYEKGDGAGHKRKIEAVDDGSGIILQNGKFGCLIHDGKVNIKWFGAKDDGATDNKDAFTKVSSYANSFINYPTNIDIHDAYSIAIYIPSTKKPFATSVGMDIKMKVEVIGDGRTRSVIKLLADVDFIKISVAYGMATNKTVISGFKVISDSNIGKIIHFEADNSQLLVDWYDLACWKIDIAILYDSSITSTSFAGNAYQFHRDCFFQSVNHGIVYRGRADRTLWCNLVSFYNIKVTGAYDAFRFEYCSGLEAIKFIGCSFNEGSKKFDGTVESNNVAGLVFDNCTSLKTIEIDSCYFEGVTPSRKSTNDEILLAPSLTKKTLFNYVYNCNQDFYYNDDKIICHSESSDAWITSGRNFGEQGCIVIKNSKIGILKVKNSSINMNDIIVNVITDASFGTNYYAGKIELVDNNGMPGKFRLHQLDNALININTSFNSQLSILFDNLGLIADDTDDLSKILNVTGNNLRAFEFKGGGYNKHDYIKQGKTNNNEIYFTGNPTNGFKGARGTTEEKIYVEELSEILEIAQEGQDCIIDDGSYITMATGYSRWHYYKGRILFTNGGGIIAKRNGVLYFRKGFDLFISGADFIIEQDGVSGKHFLVDGTRYGGNKLQLNDCVFTNTQALLETPYVFIASSSRITMNLKLSNITTNITNAGSTNLNSDWTTLKMDSKSLRENLGSMKIYQIFETTQEISSEKLTVNLWVGRTMYYTKISKPIWWDGVSWLDATATKV